MKIRFMDLQFHNECNRSCWFCPPQCKNKPIKKEIMNIQTLNKIIEFINYLEKNNLINGVLSICTNRYNEPFCDYELYIKYIKYLYTKINHKKTVIACNTNGDFINSNIIEDVFNYIHHITISLYDNNLLYAIKFINKNFINKNLIEKYILNKNEYEISFFYKKVKVIIKYNRNETIKKILRSRGSILNSNYTRTKKCDVLGNMLAFDYDGFISPCCDLYRGNKEHKKIFEEININDFENVVLFYKKASESIKDFYEKTLFEQTCKHCSSTKENSMGSEIVL